MIAVPRFRLAAAAAFAALAVAAHAAHAPLRIELRANADVGATAVTLADIATISGGDAEEASRVAAIEVGRVSADGRASDVERESVQRWVRARGGAAARDAVWAGAPRCEVRLAEGGAHAPLAPAAAASPLLAAATGPRPAVTRGSLATLKSLAGAIQLESRVEVLDDGKIGQDVRIRMPGATEHVLARVTAAGHVEVQP